MENIKIYLQGEETKWFLKKAPLVLSVCWNNFRAQLVLSETTRTADKRLVVMVKIELHDIFLMRSFITVRLYLILN